MGYTVGAAWFLLPPVLSFYSWLPRQFVCLAVLPITPCLLACIKLMLVVDQYYKYNCNALVLDYSISIIVTEMEIWFWRNFNHWLLRKLSFWQQRVQPITKISSKWHFRFGVSNGNTSLVQSHHISIKYADVFCLVLLCFGFVNSP